MKDNISWITIALSSVSSITVSLFTFALGLKAGKNQTDRLRFKEIYRSLFTYYTSLGANLLENAPKSWKSFELVHIAGNRSYSATPFRARLRKAELVELDNKLIEKLDKFEIDIMKYGNEFDEFMEK